MSHTRQTDAASILRSLAAVDDERELRRRDAALGVRVQDLKAYQQARFRASHADLLSSPRYGPAARFFLEELYGPGDFSRRDAQFARIVPALVRLFSGELVHTVALLAELHALSEALDSAMAEALSGSTLDSDAYARAWRATGRHDDRDRQIALVLDIGSALDRHTRAPGLTMSLRMMRGPARMAGLSELQGFLERGLDTFRLMGGAADFLQTIEARERALMEELFAGRPSGQLP